MVLLGRNFNEASLSYDTSSQNRAGCCLIDYRSASPFACRQFYNKWQNAIFPSIVVLLTGILPLPTELKLSLLLPRHGWSVSEPISAISKNTECLSDTSTLLFLPHSYDWGHLNA